MKKLNLDPLALDKATIALLDSKQLQEIVGGKINFNQGGCPAGATTCIPGVDSSAGSTGCGTGGSSCLAGC